MDGGRRRGGGHRTARGADPTRPGGGGRGGGLLHDRHAGDGDAVLVCDSPSPRSRSLRSGGRATGWCCSGSGPRHPASVRRPTGRGRRAPRTVIGSATVRGADCGQATSPARSAGPADRQPAGRRGRRRRRVRGGRARAVAPAGGGGGERTSTGCWPCPTPPRAAPRTWRWSPRPPAAGWLPEQPGTGARPPTPRGAVRPHQRGTQPGWSAARSSRAAPLFPRRAVAAPARGAAPSAAGGPRRRRSGGRGGGRARRCRGLRRGRLFDPSWFGLRSAEPAPQSPPVVVVGRPRAQVDDGTRRPAPDALRRVWRGARFGGGGER